MDLKRLILGIFALTTAFAALQAGPVESSGKEVQQSSRVQQADDWYRDREWNIDLFGAYAFTGTPYRNDHYLNVDHAWGGGIDVNYFFSRYFGAGLEGYAFNADKVVGQTSGNLIFRYPIPGTRVAPYGYAGGGALLNGSSGEDLVDRENGVSRHGEAEGVGQFGGGFEVRVSPHIGISNDFSWNVVNGARNNYGMVRTGLRFAF